MTVTGVLLIISITLIAIFIVRLIQVRRAYLRYKHDCKGLPILKQTWSLGANAKQIFFKTDSFANMESLFRGYGKTFGALLGTQRIAMSIDLDLFKTLNIDEQNVHINRDTFYFALTPTDTDCILFAKDDQWARIRRAMAPSFTKRSLQAKNVVGEMDSVIEHLIEAFDKKLDSCGPEGYEFDADDLTGRYATDLVFSCFYKQYNVIDYQAEKDRYWGSIKEAAQGLRSPFFEYAIWFPIIKPLVTWYAEHLHLMGKVIRMIMNFITRQTRLNFEAAKQMAELEKAGAEFNSDDFVMRDGTRFKRNLVDATIESFRVGKLTKSEYMNSSFFLFLAGLKTSADALTKLLYELASHPEEQERLRQSITEDGIDSQYMTWCLNEVLRLYPPVPGSCGRTVERDVQVEGGTIPKGTFVFAPANVIHRLPEYWGPDANIFRPERWRDTRSFHPMQYVPFGHGRRICPGKDFALFEMRKLLVAMMPKYRFDRCYKTCDSVTMTAIYMVFTIQDAPTYIRVKRLSP